MTIPTYRVKHTARPLLLTVLVVSVVAAGCRIGPTNAGASLSPATTEDNAVDQGGQQRGIEGTPPSDMIPEGIAHVECMAERGWGGSWQPDGGFVFDYTQAQTDAYLEAFDACLEASGLGNKPELTEEQWRKVYEDLKEARECLRSEGYEIPSPPSFEVYLEDPAYYPHRFVAPSTGVDIEEWRRLNEVCPQP